MFWNKKPKVIISFREPTEVEKLELEKKRRSQERLQRVRDAKDAKINDQIREIQASIAPQLQQIEVLRSKLSNRGQFHAFANAAYQQQWLAHAGMAASPMYRDLNALMGQAGMGAAKNEA